MVRFTLRAAVAACCALASYTLAAGQSRPRTAADQMVIIMRESRAKADEQYERAMSLRLAGQVQRQPRRAEPKLALAQIREDFVRIQVVNNDLADAVSRRGPLDLKFVAKSASDIRKRAGRLKDNLVLPEHESAFVLPEARGSAEAQLKSSLVTLRELIHEFVTNPLFEKANLVDIQLAMKARRDLDDIIEVCGRLKKNSEELGRAAEKSQ
ncbi:MAG TPA: hypothetical protein VD861_09215 [Pyrinomonadaceae bacterium]|nr:hypothetical protein [Pyrinomonadaceae bacterium]